MYFRVYAPNGEPFDVPRELADSLILQDGWTQSPASTAWLDSIKATEDLMAASVVVESPELVADVPVEEVTPIKEVAQAAPVKGK